jgi:hypothetical protein
VFVTAIRVVGFATLLAAVACSGTPKPKVFGTPALAPTVEVAAGERTPMHIKLTQPQSSYVSVFFVVPGEGTQLLYPTDSTGSKLLPAGEQELTTVFAEKPTVDTTRLLRRPGRPQQPQGDMDRGGGGRSGYSMQDSFILVYTATDSLAYKAIVDKVVGVTVPGYNDEAFNTVTKLIRSASTGNGRWSAVALPARP